MKIIHANCVYEEEWTIDQAKTFYSELKVMADKLLDLNDDTTISLFDEHIAKPKNPEDNQNWCGGTGKMLAFDPNGVAYPCLRYMPSSLGTSQPPITVGSVDGIFETPEDRHVKDYLDSITRRSQSTDECFNCPIAAGICLMHKARSLANVYYWNKWYKQNGDDKKFKMYLPKQDALQIISEDDYNMLLDLSNN